MSVAFGVRPRFAQGRPIMVPVPRERVGLAPKECLAPTFGKAEAPLPGSAAPSAPVAVPAAPEPSRGNLPRGPLGLAPVEPDPTGSTAGLPPTAPILRVVVEATGFTIGALKSAGRGGPLVKTRQAACFVLRRFTGRSLPLIGQAVDRDHSTVLHACRRVEAVVERIGEPEADTVEAWVAHLMGHDWSTGKTLVIRRIR